MSGPSEPINFDHRPHPVAECVALAEQLEKAVKAVDPETWNAGFPLPARYLVLKPLHQVSGYFNLLDNQEKATAQYSHARFQVEWARMTEEERKARRAEAAS